jgi:hypothetical protein
LVILPRENLEPNIFPVPVSTPKISDRKGASRVRDISEKMDESRLRKKYSETSFG